MSILHVAMSSKNCFGPVKGYLLLDQMTSRNLITSSVECECHVNLMVGPVIRTPLLNRMSNNNKNSESIAHSNTLSPTGRKNQRT